MHRWHSNFAETMRPVRPYVAPAAVVVFVSFVVLHTVSLYASSALTLLALALGLGLLVQQNPQKAYPRDNVLVLIAFFLGAYLVARLPIQSPVNDVNSILQWAGLAIAAYFLAQLNSYKISVGYGLAGLYLIVTTIPLLFVNIEQAFFNDFEGLSGWFHDNNQFGQVLGLMVVALAGGLFSQRSTVGLKFLHGFLLIVVAIPLILTNSLTAIGAAFVAMAVVFFSQLLSRFSLLSGAKAGFLSLFSVFAAIIFVNSLGVFQLLGRGDTFTGRTSIWSELLPLMPKYLLGSPISFWDTVDAQGVRDAVGFDVQTAHNSFLEVYFSAGIIVFMLLLAVIFAGLYTGFEGQKEMGTNNTFVLMLVYIFTHSLFESSLFSSYLWFGLFVASFGLRASRRFRRAGAGS